MYVVQNMSAFCLQAQLQQQLGELEQLPRTTEVRQAIAAAKKELKQFREPGQSWWPWS